MPGVIFFGTIFYIIFSNIVNMACKWKPSASQRKAFAEKMKDPNEQAAYNDRQAEKAAKKRDGSKFDYKIAGGAFVPTKAQHDYAVFDRSMNTTKEHDDACDMVAGAYACNDKCDHDYIHIVNELIRKKAYI